VAGKYLKLNNKAYIDGRARRATSRRKKVAGATPSAFGPLDKEARR
jgi:hypothetical protein